MNTRALVELAIKKLPNCDKCQPEVVTAKINMLAIIIDELQKTNASSNKNTLSRIFMEDNYDSTRKKLTNVEKAAKKLLEALNDLKGPSHIALFEAGLGNELHKLKQLTEIAAMPVQIEKPLEEKVRSNKGRPEKTDVKEITKIVAGIYEYITGQQPTVITDSTARGHPASGHFFEFLTTVFSLGNVTASAEAMARGVIADRKEEISKK